MAVTKTFPADDVGQLAALGVRDVGENRDQDAAAKVAACRERRSPGPALALRRAAADATRRRPSRPTPTWCTRSTGCAWSPPSTGRAGAAGRRVTALVQVDLRAERPTTGVAVPRRTTWPRWPTPSLAEAGTCDLGGVMAVAPHGADPAAAFARLAELAARAPRRPPAATVVSAGMSGDLEAAVAHGATHLRVGTALLGSRPPLG